MALYCTFEEALRELKAMESAETETNSKVLKEKMWQVSRRIDIEMSPERDLYFVPSIKERMMPLNQSRIKDKGLTYKPTFPLIAAQSTSLRYRATVTPYTDYVEVVDGNLMWIGRGMGWQELYSRYSAAFVVVSGTWGYADTWRTVDTITQALDTTATGITVGNASANDARLIGSRYDYGSLIKVDDEMMLVLEVNASINELTVQRGVNGSIAAAHNDNASVKLFEVEDPIRRVTARQTALLYARRGAFEVQSVDGYGVTTYPQDLLPELRGVLRGYQFGG